MPCQCLPGEQLTQPHNLSVNNYPTPEVAALRMSALWCQYSVNRWSDKPHTSHVSHGVVSSSRYCMVSVLCHQWQPGHQVSATVGSITCTHVNSYSLWGKGCQLSDANTEHPKTFGNCWSGIFIRRMPFLSPNNGRSCGAVCSCHLHLLSFGCFWQCTYMLTWT